MQDMPVSPFSQRVEMMCRQPKAFIDYKRNRPEILSDKKAYEKYDPYHLRMLREEEERRQEELRLLREENDEVVYRPT